MMVCEGFYVNAMYKEMYVKDMELMMIIQVTVFTRLGHE